jgi:hypothetical protein
MIFGATIVIYRVMSIRQRYGLKVSPKLENSNKANGLYMALAKWTSLVFVSMAS